MPIILSHVGVVVFPLVAIYVYGVTALITGLSPNELLFDTPRFLAFGVALGVVAVPLVVAALVHTESPTLANGVAIGVAVLAALAGLLLARRASRQWADRSADP